VTWTIGMKNFWIFLGCFLVLFVAGGVGNGSTYRMIPSVFAARSGVANAATNSGDVSTQRKTAASLGLISAIGAYGGFVIPQMLGLSKSSTGEYTSALNMFVVAYVVLMIVTGVVYLRRGSAFSGQRI
jgi:NNP family nitrate/nitrite transporter-like MFS transporter